MSTEGVLKLLIDTNVWMDYFSGRSDRTANVVHLIEIADASERKIGRASCRERV